ncbi:hypothetical protein GCM10017744_101620 [Streptomyces antimycoticus]
MTTFLELGPDGVLSAMGEDCLAETETGTGTEGEAGTDAVFVPTLRSGRSEAQALATALAHAHVRGAARTGRRSTPGAAPAAWSCPPTPSSASATGSTWASPSRT